MKQFIITIFTFFSFNSYCQQKEIDSIILKCKKDFSETGIVVGIIADGKRTYYTSGNRSLENSIKLDSLTIFEIGSATKTFTGLLLAKEIVNGKFHYNDFIDSYLPNDISLPCNLAKKIKLTDLASHQSGLPNLSNDKYFEILLNKDPRNPFRFVNKDYIYTILKETESLINYRAYQYNNYAFSLLGTLISEINTLNYKELVNKEILEPLKMTNTSFKIPSDEDNRAGLYNQRGEPQEYLILENADAAGGLKSNAVDLLKYLTAHFNDEQFIDVVNLTRRTYLENSAKRIGLGWEIKDEYYEKDGDTFGNSCLIRYSNDKQIGIVILSNHQNGQLVRELMNEIYNVVIDKSTAHNSDSSQIPGIPEKV